MKKEFTLFLIAVIGLLSCSSQNMDYNKKIDPIIEYNNEIDPTLKYHVILMGGQSNMRGQGKISDLPKTKFENVTYYNFGMSPSLKTNDKSFGPEVGLSKILSERFPDKNFILIKYAIGGSSMLDWTPNYDPEKAEITGHPEYGNMYRSLLQKVDSLTDGLNTEIVALTWAQGAADARVPEAGNEYYENFKLFISSIRSDLDSPELPVLFGITNPPKSKYPAVDIVRSAQRSINENVKNTYLIEADDLEKWADNLHFSSKGQLEFGKRFGEQLTEIIQN